MQDVNLLDKVLCVECSKPIPPQKRKDAIYCSPRCGDRFRVRRWENNNPETVKTRRAKNNSNIPKRIHSRVKSRAKRLGIPFTITVDDIVVPSICPVLGIEISVKHGRKGMHPNSPSLDRIDPYKGYVPGNVRVISGRANLLKSDATPEELEAVLADLRKLYEKLSHSRTVAEADCS